MSHFLLYHRQTAPTGRALANALDIPHGGDPPAEPVDTLIRWGAIDSIRRQPQRVINKRDAIKLASNKYQSLVRLNRRGVRVPPVYWWTAGDSYVELPAFGRKSFHTGGTDIHFCMQSRDLDGAVEAGCDHFVKYIPTLTEYRVHVLFGEAIRVNEKIKREAGTATANWIRNWDNGYRFLRPRRALRDTEQQTALDAVAALGLDFGAVDLVIGDDQKAYVLEVNTAPGLVDTDTGEGIGIDAYVTAFRPLLSAEVAVT